MDNGRTDFWKPARCEKHVLSKHSGFLGEAFGSATPRMYDYKTGRTIDFQLSILHYQFFLRCLSCNVDVLQATNSQPITLIVNQKQPL